MTTHKDTVRRFYKKYVTYLTITPVIVGVSIILASIIIANLISHNLSSVQSQAIDKQMRENRLLVQNTFDSYTQIVWSGVGRVTSGPLDRASWNTFISAYDLPKNNPSINSLVITKVIRPDEKQSYIDLLSSQYDQPIQLTKDSADQADNVVAYVSPEKSSTINNIGFNLYDNPVRAKALQRATDSGTIAMTDQLELLENAKNQQTTDGAAFIMYAPYYKPNMPLDTVERRRQAIDGHAGASFKTAAVFDDIFKRIDQTHIATRVSMGNNTTKEVVYSSKATRPDGPQVVRSQDISIYGQTFAVSYIFDRDYLVSKTQLQAPLYTLVVGTIAAFLVSVMTFFFLRGRHHRSLLDKERDVTRAKDELLSLASHQLRTPATGVKQYMGMVLQGFVGDITSAQKDLLEKAYKSNERQLHVINDILHLAKLDLGRIILAKTEFDLAELVRDVSDEQQQDVEVGELTLTQKVPKKAMVYADKHMLRMVYENVLSNAIKYTNPQGTITIQLKNKSDIYEIIVRDTGVGIDNEDIPKLFKQFSRIMNSRSHLVTGTGVGLYLSQHLIEQHGGEIIVESKPSKGSIFTIRLPKTTKKL